MRARLLLIAVILARAAEISSAGENLTEEPAARVTADTRQSATIETPGLRVTFAPEGGRLTGVLDKATAHDHIDDAQRLALWQAVFADGGILGPHDATRFVWKPLVEPERGLELLWAGFDRAGLPSLEVKVRVSPGPSPADSRWRIALEGIGGRRLSGVRFPRLPAAREEPETLAVPVWMGELTRRARELLHRGGRLGRREWEYPGTLSIQCLALYRDGGPGLLMTTNDTAALRKLFAVFALEGEGLGLELLHLPPLSEEDATRYEPPYEVVVRAFRGDWYDAAESYRRWALEQLWARESRMRRGLVPPWVLEAALWVWNRGRSPGVLGPAKVLREASGLPVSVFWHWWHGCAYDVGFPEYLPPREGEDAFRRALSGAHEAGIHALVYMNQRLWGMTTRSWLEEGAERYAVKGPDGRVAPEVYNTFTRAPCASMCMGTEFWRRRYAESAEAAVRRLGVDGIYMDQACSSLACYDAAHGHPLGGGSWWMEGFRRLEGDIRSRTADAKPVALAGEGCGESWLPHLDAMLSLQVSMERYAAPGEWEPIPFFHTVYHGCALFFGSYSSLTRPPYDDLWPAEHAPTRPLELLDRKFSTQLRLEQARAFVWGQQPTIANFLPSHLADRKEEMDFILALARLRREALPYLRDGTFLRPPRVDVPRMRIPMSRLSIYAGQREAVQEFEADVPQVLASAWEAPGGGVAVAAVNISDRAVPIELSLESPHYPLPRAGFIRRITTAGRTEVGTYVEGSVSWSAALGPTQAAIYEIVGR